MNAIVSKTKNSESNLRHYTDNLQKATTTTLERYMLYEWVWVSLFCVCSKGPCAIFLAHVMCVLSTVLIPILYRMLVPTFGQFIFHFVYSLLCVHLCVCVVSFMA